MALTEVTSAEQLQQLAASNGVVVVHFWAGWAPQCEQMNDVLSELSNLHPGVKFVKVEAEQLPDVSEQHEIVAVPTVVVIKGGAPVDRVDGANAAELTKKVAKHASGAGPTSAGAAAPAAAAEDIDARLKKLVNAAPVMLFMKGTPDEPQCGFSRKIVGLLKDAGTEFSTFNILADQTVRQELKRFSDWPTYPQLYVKGELLGGLDIVKELIESGEFATMVPKEETEEQLRERIKSIIEREPVMLFMKGTPDAPRCGFSRTTVGILKEVGAKYGTYDILGDEAVRQGIKKYSDWPTFPQLYVDSEFIGGLDIIKELQETDELKAALKLA
eukprot:m.480632 g.480632  ORF g.480632 m.480632 type:complete len:329 (+) comp21904_c0_seq1:182-1168(+)